MRASEEDLWRAYFNKTLFGEARQDWRFTRLLHWLALINSSPPLEYDENGKLKPPPDDWEPPYDVMDFLIFERPGLRFRERPENDKVAETAVSNGGSEPGEMAVPQVQRGRAKRGAAERRPSLADPHYQQEILKQLDRAFGR